MTWFNYSHDEWLDPTLHPASMCYDADALADPTAGRPHALPPADAAEANRLRLAIRQGYIAAARQQVTAHIREAMASGDNLAYSRWVSVDDLLREAYLEPELLTLPELARQTCETLLGAKAATGIEWPPAEQG